MSYFFIYLSISFNTQNFLINQVDSIKSSTLGSPVILCITIHGIEVKKGDIIGQVIFMKYLTVDNDTSEGTRKGGFGSTDK